MSWKSETASDTGEGRRDEMVKIIVIWGGELEDSVADIIKGFVINTHNLIDVFYKLMDRKDRVVWLYTRIGDLWGWHDGETDHHSVWVFLSDLGDEEGSHTGSGTTTEGVGDLETLEAIATFGFLSYDIED